MKDGRKSFRADNIEMRKNLEQSVGNYPVYPLSRFVLPISPTLSSPLSRIANFRITNNFLANRIESKI